MEGGIRLDAVKAAFARAGLPLPPAEYADDSVSYMSWHSLVKELKTSASTAFGPLFSLLVEASLSSEASPSPQPPAPSPFGAKLSHPLGLQSACSQAEATFCGGGKSHLVDVILHAGFTSANPFPFFVRRPPTLPAISVFFPRLIHFVDCWRRARGGNNPCSHQVQKLTTDVLNVCLGRPRRS